MESTGWAVIHCLAPEPAAETLDRLGYTTYLPRYRRRLIGVRIDARGRRIRTRGLGSIVDRVLFPSYLLILWRPGLRERPIHLAGGPGIGQPLGGDGDGGRSLKHTAA